LPNHNAASVRSVMAPPACIAFRQDWRDFSRGRRRRRRDRKETGTDEPERGRQAAGRARQERPFIAQEPGQLILKPMHRLGVR
jgi:hypothetical protein